MRKNKGITLVALIITIVVMLILVAVSVNVVIKSNLIGTAEKTVDKYKTVAEEEGNGGTIEIDGKKYDSLDNFLNEKGIIDEVHNWIRTGDELTCKCKQCTNNGENTEGITLTIGQEVNYVDNGAGSSSITAEKASGYTETAELKNGIKIASLNTNKGLKIAAAPGGGPITRPVVTQTINKDNLTKWIVLGVEDGNKNGTNETLLLTTEKPTTGKIILYGAAGYNNGRSEINRMCKEIYGEGARCISIEDVNNCLEYKPTEVIYLDQSSQIQKISNFTTRLNELPEDIWNSIKNNQKTPDGQDTEEAFGNIVLNYYNYSVSSNGKFSDNEKKLIVGTSNDYSYWLDSSAVDVDAHNGYARFGIGYVSSNSVQSGSHLMYSNGSSFGIELSIRAVVSLRTDIPGVIE